jgi:hypothetical protein
MVIDLTDLFPVRPEKKLLKNYSLHWIDGEENMELAYLNPENDYVFSIVKAKVIAAGYNEKVIIVKQKDVNRSGAENYFIVPLARPISTSFEKNLIGPLTFKEFTNGLHEFNSDEVQFTIKN